jgi:hypothetical protein
MKTILFAFCFLLLAIGQKAFAQEPLKGAWRLLALNGSPLEKEERVIIFSDTYFMYGQYKNDGSFVKAAGGSYSTDSAGYRQVYEFHTKDSTLVQEAKSYTLQIEKEALRMEGKDALLWERIEEDITPMGGAWRFSARVDEDGLPGERRTPGPRKTIKILSGSRFQWAAFNTQTREFMGTGGGTYQLIDDTYTETILFFSRDDDKVGISLEFKFKIDGDDWYHKGFGTTGKPVHEVWERIDGGME